MSESKTPAQRSSRFPPRGKNKRPDFGLKNDLLCAFGEFLGTAIFLFLALGGTNFARLFPFQCPLYHKGLLELCVDGGM